MAKTTSKKSQAKSKVTKSKDYPLITLIILVAFVCFINFKPFSHIIGFDNISPYFGLRPILDKTFGNGAEHFISFNPLLLITPIFAFLRLLQIPSWLINQLYLTTSLAIGVFGAAKLSRYIFQRLLPKFASASYLVGGIIYLTTLLTFWIFSQANFLFVAAYAVLPWGVYFMTKAVQKDFIFIRPKIKKVLSLETLRWIFYLWLGILFLQTSLNLVAFFSYIACILILAYFFNLTLKNKISLKRLVLLPIAIITAWLLLLQLELILSGNFKFIFTVIYDHFHTLQNNPISKDISDSIIESGVLRGDIFSTITFRGGWMEANDLEGELLFQHYDLYNSTLSLMFTIIPLSLILVTLIFPKKRQSGRILIIHILLILGVLLNSGIFLDWIKDVPFISTAFRWNTSKFWPLIVFPLSTLVTLGVGQIFINSKQKLQKITLGIFILLQIINSYPMFLGQLYSEKLTVSLPSNYSVISNEINSDFADSKILYLPKPQQLYFYTYTWVDWYDWGPIPGSGYKAYFGSDFLGYMTRGDYEEQGIVSYFYNSKLYEKIQEDLVTCNKDKILKTIKNENIDLIILDEDIVYDDDTPEKMKTCIESFYDSEFIIDSNGENPVKIYVMP